MKKYPFLNINPSNMIVVKISHALLYIYHQTVSKYCFLVGENRYQSYVYFQALKRHFWQKSCFLRTFYSQHILISLQTLQMKDNDRSFNLIPKYAIVIIMILKKSYIFNFRKCPPIPGFAPRVTDEVLGQSPGWTRSSETLPFQNVVHA